MRAFHQAQNMPNFNYGPLSPQWLGLYCSVQKTGFQQTQYNLVEEVEVGIEEVYNWSKLVHMAKLREFDRVTGPGFNGIRPNFDPPWVPLGQIPDEAKVECRKAFREFMK